MTIATTLDLDERIGHPRMLQKPNLSDDNVVSCVCDSYGLTVTELEFLPIGYYTSACYRARADDGKTYFLKVRKGPVDDISLAVPRSLKDAGVTQVVAPTPAIAEGKPWGTIDDYALILYPFIQGRSAMKLGLSDPQWVAYGAILRAIHRARLPDAVRRRVPRESFVSTWVRGLRRLQAAVERSDDQDPYARELSAVWKERRDQITHIAERAEELGRRLRGRPVELVLCHTDPHTNNILVDPDGRLFLVDWDAPLLAPKERDLHFVIGSVIGGVVIGPREEALIFQGYGPTTIDWLALIYYRYEWLSGDLLDCGERVFVLKDSGEATKEDAIQGTRRMFEPGNAVASAYELERRRPHPD